LTTTITRGKIIVSKLTNDKTDIEGEGKFMCMYGYCRISTKQQSIDRQIRNIKNCYDKAVIIQEVYTGTKQDRPEWNKLYKKAKTDDTIILIVYHE